MTYIPSDLLRPIAAFRALSGREAVHSIGCGILTKSPGWDVKDFTPSSFAAVLCLRGTGTYYDASGASWPLAEGSLFLRRTGQTHSVEIHDDGKWAECWIVLASEVESLLSSIGALSTSCVIESHCDLALIRELRRTAETLEKAPEQELHQLFVRLVGILVGLLDRASSITGEDFDLNLACRLLAEDPRANLRAVARDMGMGWERFRKLFRESAGISPGAYRLRRRLERAQAELLASKRSINEIAEDLGYANPFTFSRLFHRHVGCTPSAWRASGHHQAKVAAPAL